MVYRHKRYPFAE